MRSADTVTSRRSLVGGPSTIHTVLNQRRRIPLPGSTEIRRQQLAHDEVAEVDTECTRPAAIKRCARR